jgi:hypothetical protein
MADAYTELQYWPAKGDLRSMTLVIKIDKLREILAQVGAEQAEDPDASWDGLEETVMDAIYDEADEDHDTDNEGDD